MRPVAVRRILREFTHAHGCFFGMLSDKYFWREAGSFFVSAVAPGLVGGLPTRAPGVLFPLFKIHHLGHSARYFRLFH